MKSKVPYTEENLQKAVSVSYDYSQTLLQMGRRVAGGNMGTLKKYIALWDIDTSHFKRAKSNIHLYLVNGPMDNDLWFVKGIRRNNGQSKNRLYESGLKKRECEFCGQGEYWREKYMGLILDHIDGDSVNNAIENLRVLCPNCNATLDTHCGRKNRKIKLVPEGPKPKLKRPGARRVKDRPASDILLKEIEELGYAGTGRKYGVSDNAVRKWLK